MIVTWDDQSNEQLRSLTSAHLVHDTVLYDFVRNLKPFPITTVR